MRNFLASSWGIVLVGLIIGISAVLLQILGNPPNMGICVACFERDIAGSIGLHQASVVQYMRPEIIGLVLGAFFISMIKGENSSKGGSAPLIRFFLGIFAMVGALVFLGCPWRTILRIAGGDVNAIIGLAGLIVGIYGGVFFLKNGFSLGRAYRSKHRISWIAPLFFLGLFVLHAFEFKFSTGGALYVSAKGPGAMHVNIWLGLAAGIVIGVLVQRSRFCTMGVFRDILLIKDFHLARGVGAMLLAALVLNLIIGKFNFGMASQPIAHSDIVWNFLGMVLAGLCFSMAGGCPGRQLILTGEGNSDSGIFVMGMIFGAGLAHNFALASSPGGVTAFGPYAVILGIIFCVMIGLIMRTKIGVRR